MHVTIIGADGSLGREMIRACTRAGHTPAGFDIADCDITDCPAVASLLAGRSGTVVNCAAYTRVDDAEANRDVAFAINADGAGHVAAACAAEGLRLLHISTDYVFDGTLDRAYRETDEPNPLNVYGASKLAGEITVRNACPRALIIRTQSLFSPTGVSFLGKVLPRLRSGTEPVRVVQDQVSCPTFVPHLAAAMVHLLTTEEEGLLHVSAAGSCSWYELAVALRDATGTGTDVVPVESVAYPTPARRPAQAALDKQRLRERTGIALPHWRDGLKEWLAAQAD